MFGFRAAIPQRVQRSLVREANALVVQSRDHPDGWGVGYWHEGREPRIDRGLSAAFSDREFAQAAERVVARAAIAHVRRASCGPITLPNTHPFHHGRWLFAHNGTVADFERHRAKLEAEIDPALRPLLGGDTDSERCFLLFLTHLAEATRPEHEAAPSDVARALRQTVLTVRGVADRLGGIPSSLTFIVSDGQTLLAVRHGRSLYQAAEDGLAGALQRFSVASEIVDGERRWHEVPDGALVGVGPDLRPYA